VGRKYATGNHAWFICQRCGLRGLYRNSVFDGHIANLRVHPECWEPKHPQESLPKVTDPIALWRPSPEWGGTPSVLEAVLNEETGFIELSWTEAEIFNARFESYDVYRAIVDPVTSEIGEYVLLEALPITYGYDMEILDQTLTYTDEDVEFGVTYAYKVIANASN
jgi:hypothetical protein